MKLKTAGVSIVFTVLLAGCASSDWTWERAQTTELQMNHDIVECEDWAAGAYPIVMASVGMGHQEPPESVCMNIGDQMKCEMRQGRFMPPRTVDANLDNRQAATNACLEQKGYTRVPIQD